MLSRFPREITSKMVQSSKKPGLISRKGTAPTWQQLSMGIHPFTRPTADVVLASSDNVAFCVHRTILSEASHVFADMLSTASAADSTSGTVSSDEHRFARLPIYPVSEDSKTLENVLRLCYPVSDPELSDTTELHKTLAAVAKYEMEEALGIIKGRLRALIRLNPFEAYAIACSFALEEIARKAAVQLSGKDARGFAWMTDGHSSPRYEGFTAGAYVRLLSFVRNQSDVSESFCFTRRADQDVPLSAIIEEAEAVPAVAHPMPPFDWPDADLVLHTADSVEFRVHRLILEMASPVFRDVLSKPLPSVAATERLARPHPRMPLLRMEETSKVVVVLLQVYYPTCDLEADDVELVLAALAAAKKYDMQKAEHILAAGLLQMTVPPVRVFLVACRLGLQTLAVEASKRLLHLGLDELETYQPEMEHVPAETYERLRRFHATSMMLLDAFIRSYTSIPLSWQAKFRRLCQKSNILVPASDKPYYDRDDRRSEMSVTCWFNSYIEEVLWKLREHRPCLSIAACPAVLESAMAVSERRRSCAACQSSQGLLLLMEFSQFFAKEIEKRVR
ncbi:uncharacterized protein LAESUDRAFT_725224 [Laetiporus sulphureus 93-53]|uniref:BTB domain-containing protein n=1 Tax=Laetiporus sulphureus 93-53 TaxID=1314785 RepID=A0A165ELJ3_9APHY|nr:uncharacterized protein LAESUDRAFT_725224 [Laetiporus sulphureus 93-53]KZT07309.1 hypothetical protein LAESUDRAFT_725224 [Laetiporus sulphureus 93-53]